MFGVPIALVSLIDDRRNLHKAASGMTPGSVPRELSFCAHAVAADAPLVVRDAT